MGIESAILGPALGVVGGIGSIFGGNSANAAANSQANLIMRETDIKAKEKEREVKEFESQQKVDYASSGVILSGSPLLVLEETRERGFEDVKNIRETGRASAASARAEGRAAMTRGLFGGIASIGQALS